MLLADKDIILHETSEKFATELFEVIDRNRPHLSRFLPWVGNMTTREHIRSYLEQSEQMCKEKKEASFIIFQQNKIVGRIGLHYLHPQNKSGAIGYWLDEKATGRGIITRSCAVLIEYGFESLALNRIEIKAATQNDRSQAIPAKLNFTKEGLLRQAENMNGQFLDLFIYSLLKEDWKKNSDDGRNSFSTT